MQFDRELIKHAVADLTAKGIFIGTSSWKYEGWLGQIYTADRYKYRGKVATKRFERDCLKEYAETFKTVSVDAGYYRFPEHRYIEGMVSQVPSDFLFSFKVTDEITVKKFTNQTRYGERAGKPNENFLNADLFASAFVKPFEPFRSNIGLFIFEFSKFYPSDYAHGRDFVADLDRFLETVPKGWPYGIELRNDKWLTPEYFGCLSKHGITHVFNSWSKMPPVGEQLEMTGSMTNSQLAAARFLLKPGRSYEQAVKEFGPVYDEKGKEISPGYERRKELYREAIIAAVKLINRSLTKEERRMLFLYINNRLEGNAVLSIQAVLEELFPSLRQEPHD